MPEPLTPESIIALRHRLGLTQVAFAALVGCNGMSVWLWEHGRRTPTGLYAKAVLALMATHPEEVNR